MYKILILLGCLPLMAFSYYEEVFDQMRCKGDLIEKDTTLSKVKQLCGELLYEKEDKNDFRTYTYVTYPNSGTSRYYLLFKNDHLLLSREKGNLHDDYIWINPETLDEKN